MAAFKNQQTAYSIGLDIGVGSVGWAVTDNYGHLLKKGNTHLWGYSLFDPAMSAQERRVFRSTRRRYNRRKQRIHLLQDLTEDMVLSIDPVFFRRLENSYLVPEDRTDELILEHSILFAGDYNDTLYYKDYPTIYHLRNHLMESDQKEDPRLIYLAMHHIIKYRGNFLYEGQTFNINNSDEIRNKYNSLIAYLNELHSIDIDPEGVLYEKLMDRCPKRERIDYLKTVVADKETRKFSELIFKAVQDYKFDVNALFGIETEISSINFSQSDIEDKKEQIAAEMTDDFDVFIMLEDLYSYLTLREILTDSTISKSQIAIYEKHHKDLEILKQFLRSNPKGKKTILGAGGSYDTYINNPKNKSLDDLYKDIRKFLGDDEISLEINSEIENEKFLLRQNSTRNGTVPYQLNLMEVEAIIDHQSKYYPVLKKNREKILSLVSFRIPYWMGPLDADATNAWIIRNDPKDKEPIRAWNWKEKVNSEATAQKFIERMRNHCTYLLAESTLPKNSMLLSYFNVLDELNKVRYLDQPNALFIPAVKQQIIDELFLKKNNVSINDLRNWLIDHQYARENEIKISGTRKENGFASNLKPVRDFMRIFGSEFNEENYSRIETIIEYLTVYNDKEIIRRRLLNEKLCTEEQCKQILKLSYSGYGRISAKLINGLTTGGFNSSPKTVLEIMESTNKNFMQIINDTSYDFKDKIAEENGSDDSHRISYENDVNALPGSPALKRGIWQSVLVVRDIVKYMKHDPANIYIEFAREEGKKKRTKSRYSVLEAIYREHINNSELMKELNSYKDRDISDRVFLYFMQEGKCLYSGKKLYLTELDKYQIDHILPQSYIKDDSLQNKALVLSAENQRKKDSLLLDDSIIRRQKTWWQKLADHNLMGKKKYANLTRMQVTEDNQAKFIERQLVETRQIIVHVRNLLTKEYSESNVTAVHAPISSECREKFELYKIRELNHTHHAQDAYLACFVGIFTDLKYPSITNGDLIRNSKLKKRIIKEISGDLKEESKNPEKKYYSFLVRQIETSKVFDSDTGELIWNGTDQISYIQKIFEYKDYFSSIRTNIYDGKLYKASIFKSAGNEPKTKATIRIKQNRPVEKYGGYTNIEYACGYAVEYKKGKKMVRVVVAIPVMYDHNEKAAMQYLQDECKSKDVKIIRKLPLNVLFRTEDTLLKMASPSEWSIQETIFLSKKAKKAIYLLLNSRKTDEVKIIEEYETDLENAYVELLTKIYQNVPILRDRLDDPKKFDYSEQKKSNFENIRLSFNELQTEDKKKAFVQLMSTVETGCDCINSTGVKLGRFARFHDKTIHLENTEFIFTSPSGLYSSIWKYRAD